MNPENKKLNITPKDRPEIHITERGIPKILITQKMTDTLKIEDVYPLNRDQFGVNLKNREDIKRIVEIPLVEACEIFWDKNIKTVESSANKEDIQSGHGWIVLDWDSLSEENKKIAESQSGSLRKAHGGSETLFFYLEIPMSKGMLAKDISKTASDIANKFQKQKLTWLLGTTLGDRMTQIERMRQLPMYKNVDPKDWDIYSRPTPTRIF